MDLINWSLSAIDTIFSTRSLGSGEPVCPDGTFAAGYTRDAWEKWQIVCLAALSVEDAEDIYLFGTMITGILLIGLGFTLGYRKIQKTGNSCPKSHKAARFDWSCGKSGQQWDWDYKPEYGYHHDETRSFGSETWWFQRSEWTKRMSCGLQLFAPKSQQFNLIFSGSPYRRLGQGRLDNHPERAMEWDSLPPFPDYRHYSPPPFNCLCKRFAPPLGWAGLLTGAEINGTGPDGCLPELDMFPRCNVMCLWYMCFVLRCFFSVLRLYSKWSIVWGLNNFFLLSLLM